MPDAGGSAAQLSPRRGGGTGRRSGLKIPWPTGRPGSMPGPGIQSLILSLILNPSSGSRDPSSNPESRVPTRSRTPNLMPSRTFDAFPEQAAAIPVRRVGRGLQVCVIRRKDSNSWGIPKGLVDPGRHPRGNGAQRSVGRSGYQRPAARRGDWHLSLPQVGHPTDGGGVCDGGARAGARPGKSRRPRQRRWVPFAEAGVLLADHPVAPLLDRARTLSSPSGGYRLA